MSARRGKPRALFRCIRWFPECREHRYKIGMSNIIRPVFGAPKPNAGPSMDAPVVEYTPVRIFGPAAGYTVALIGDDDQKLGPVFKVVVGPSAGNKVEAVAILPATPEGEADADVVGMAILRTLELIGAPRET
jgi:hypothetical protein